MGQSSILEGSRCRCNWICTTTHIVCWLFSRYRIYNSPKSLQIFLHLCNSPNKRLKSNFISKISLLIIFLSIFPITDLQISRSRKVNHFPRFFALIYFNQFRRWSTKTPTCGISATNDKRGNPPSPSHQILILHSTNNSNSLCGQPPTAAAAGHPEWTLELSQSERRSSWQEGKVV